MKWLRLEKNKTTSLRMGSILKFPVPYQFEGEVAMMICTAPDNPQYFALMAITGFKAGYNCYSKLPHHIYNDGELLTEEIYNNWHHWIQSDGDSNKTLFLPNGFDVLDIKARTRRWVKLSQHKDAVLSRGSLLRFSATYPFEDEVVMMVCDSPLGDYRLGLITISGYKAGFNCYTSFPEGVRNDDGSITAGIIYDNWGDWIWPEWSPDDAWILPEGLSVDDLK